MEEEPPAAEEVSPEGGAAASRVWSREEGRDPASFFYGSELAYRHLRDPTVMSEVSTAPKMLWPEVLPRISPACAVLTVRDPSFFRTSLSFIYGCTRVLTPCFCRLNTWSGTWPHKWRTGPACSMSCWSFG